MSPRKQDWVGVAGVVEIMSQHGVVNRETGEPLTLAGISRLTQGDPSFPKPVLTEPRRRYWRRVDVEKWVPTYTQKTGPKPWKADAMVKLIESQPGRIWTVRELTIWAQRKPVFAGLTDLRRVVRDLLSQLVRRGRIQRVRMGRYQALPKNGQAPDEEKG